MEPTPLKCLLPDDDLLSSTPVSSPTPSTNACRISNLEIVWCLINCACMINLLFNHHHTQSKDQHRVYVQRGGESIQEYIFPMMTIGKSSKKTRCLLTVVPSRSLFFLRTVVSMLIFLFCTPGCSNFTRRFSMVYYGKAALLQQTLFLSSLHPAAAVL